MFFIDLMAVSTGERPIVLLSYCLIVLLSYCLIVLLSYCIQNVYRPQTWTVLRAVLCVRTVLLCFLTALSYFDVRCYLYRYEWTRLRLRGGTGLDLTPLFADNDSQPQDSPQGFFQVSDNRITQARLPKLGRVANWSTWQT